jgi:hypothetical protein
MKSAKTSLWLNPGANANPKAPALNGWIELPASLVWELGQALQANQGLETNPTTGEPMFKLRVSVWNRDGANNGPVLSGEIESPSERAAYLASKAAPAAANGNGAMPWMQQQAASATPPATPPAAPPAQPPAQPAPWQAPELPQQQQIAPPQAPPQAAPGGWQSF